MTEAYQALNTLILGAGRILLTAHEHPDGDSIGALLALSYALDWRKKDWVAFTNDPPPDYFSFLDIGRISSDPGVLRPGQFDLVIFLDVGDVKRTAATGAVLTGPNGPRVVNIDHHPTTTIYQGASVVDLNIVIRTLSSTSEILYDFFRTINVPVTRPMATSLLTGILTDTGSFSNLGTTIGSMRTASQLLTRGALIQEVTNRTWKNKSLAMLKLWGRALSRLKRNETTGVVTTAIFQTDLAECGVDNQAAEGIANFLNSLEDATAALLLREMPDGLVNGSYRTTAPDVDVAKIAAQYGGGGHVKASGFTAAGRIVETDLGWDFKPA